MRTEPVLVAYSNSDYSWIATEGGVGRSKYGTIWQRGGDAASWQPWTTR
ncbi:hypothetical protein ACFV4G_15620 [Kitasatospora sp. NPDC059747]